MKPLSQPLIISWCAWVHAQLLTLCLTLVSPLHCVTTLEWWTVAHHLLCPWNFPGDNTRMDGHALLQRISQTQGLNPGPLHCKWILFFWATREARYIVCLYIYIYMIVLLYVWKYVLYIFTWISTLLCNLM